MNQALAQDIDNTNDIETSETSDNYIEYIRIFLEEIEENTDFVQPVLFCSQRLIKLMLNGLLFGDIKDRADNMYQLIEELKLPRTDWDYSLAYYGKDIQKKLKEVSKASSEYIKKNESPSREKCDKILDTLSNAYYEIEQYRFNNDIFFDE